VQEARHGARFEAVASGAAPRLQQLAWPLQDGSGWPLRARPSLLADKPAAPRHRVTRALLPASGCLHASRLSEVRRPVGPPALDAQAPRSVTRPGATTTMSSDAVGACQ